MTLRVVAGFCLNLKYRSLSRCDVISSGCGWCWDSGVTENQTHGGLEGDKHGPFSGQCSDWTYDAAECKNHVDCLGDVLYCRGIFNTNCGWCYDDDVGTTW